MSLRWYGSLFLVLACTVVRAGDEPDECAPLIDCSPFDGDGGAAERFYGGVDYLVWWTKRQSLPPLVTRGDISDPGIPGALGQPHTVVLFGDTQGGGGSNQGGRFTAGYWLDDERSLAVEGSFFFLGQQTYRFTASSAGDPNGTTVLALPFVDETTRQPDVQTLAAPGAQAASVGVALSRRLLGAEANARLAGWRDGGLRLDLLSGFRFLALDEQLDVATRFQDLTGLATFSNGASAEGFATRNRFYGGQVGAEATWGDDRWLVRAGAKVALGGTAEVVHINGTTVVVDRAGTTTTAPTGLFAQPTNMGRHARGAFSFVPEAGVSVGYRLTSRLRAHVGYTIIYDSDVARPAGQIDPIASTPTLVGPLPAGQAHPAFRFHGTDFWAQGLDLGLELDF